MFDRRVDRSGITSQCSFKPQGQIYGHAYTLYMAAAMEGRALVPRPKR